MNRTTWVLVDFGLERSFVEISWPLWDIMVVYAEAGFIRVKQDGSVWLSNDQGMSFDEARPGFIRAKQDSLGVWIEARMSFWRWAETWASKLYLWVNSDRMAIAHAIGWLPAFFGRKRKRAEFDMAKRLNAPGEL